MNEVAIYVRVSTEEQAKKNLSIPNQIYTLENYCKNKNLNIYKIYRDEGVSGAISFKERPGLKALTDDAKLSRFNLILVYDINRLGRSENLFEFYDFLYYKGISVGDTSTIYDYNDINKKLHRNVETVFAIWDRDKIRKMTIDGKRERVRQGKLFLGYPTPYGYIKHDRNFKIVKEEANVIKKIFDLYLNGNGCIKIANYLNKNKYPTQHINKNRRPSAKYWRDSRIRKILRNPIYKGEYIHFKNSIYNEPVVIKIPAIIDEITYEKAQKISNQNKLFSKRNSKREYKYKGLIICKNDNLSWHGEYDCRLNKKFYMCNGRRFKNCNSGRIYEKELDKNIWEYIKEMILNPETLEEDIKANLNRVDDDIDFTEIKRLKKEREKLKNKMDKIIDLYQDDLIDKQEYSTRYSNFAKSINEIDFRLKELNINLELKTNGIKSFYNVEDYLTRFKDYVNSHITEDETANVIRMFVDKIIIDSVRDPLRNKPYLRHTAKVYFKLSLENNHELKSNYRDNRALIHDEIIIEKEFDLLKSR